MQEASSDQYDDSVAHHTGLTLGPRQMRLHLHCNKQKHLMRSTKTQAKRASALASAHVQVCHDNALNATLDSNCTRTVSNITLHMQHYAHHLKGPQGLQHRTPASYVLELTVQANFSGCYCSRHSCPASLRVTCSPSRAEPKMMLWP